MYDQREPLKYGSTYLPRQSSNSRRFKNGQRPFMSRPSDFIIVAVIVVAAGVASMWFISRLPYFLEGASSVYDWATDVTLTWGTPSMWWLFVNLIVLAIVLSSGFVSNFGSNSGTDPYQPVYIEKDISDPASAGVPLDSSSDIPEDSVESYEEDSFRSYVPPAKPKAAVPIPYTKIQPEYEAPPSYEATPVYEVTPVYEAAEHTDQRGAERASPVEKGESHIREIPASINVSELSPVISEPPVGYPGTSTAEPARSVEGEEIERELVSSRSIPPVVLSSRSIPNPIAVQAEPEVVAEVKSGDPEVVLSKSVASAGVAATEPEEEVGFAKQEKLVADDEFNASVRNLESTGTVTGEIEDPPVAYPPAPGVYDPFTVIDEPPIGYGKLQRNFTEGGINYVVKPDEPLISAPPPKAELVKAHTFTSGRAFRRDQIDSYVEPLARKLEEMKRRDEEMKRRDEINRRAFHVDGLRDETSRKGFHAETTRTHNRDTPAETMTRDMRPAKVHSRNSSIDVTSKDIQHSYPTEVFYPPPVQSLPADIAHYFSSAHQAPPGDAELRRVTPAPPPAVMRPPPKKVALTEGLERPLPKRTSTSEVPERPPSRKIPTAEVLERQPLKKTIPEAPERMSSTRKPSPIEVPEPTDQAPQAEVLHRPFSKKTTTAETITVESVPARIAISKKTAALEALADKLHRPKKAPADGLSDLLQRPPSSKKAPPPGGTERDLPKQTSQTEGVQRPVPKQTLPVQTPLQVPVPPVIKTSPPPSPPAVAPLRKQVSPPPPPPPLADDFSPPTSPPMLRPMPPPPPPHLKIPSPVDVSDPFLGSSSDDTSGFKFYQTERRNSSPKKEASSSADMSSRSAKYAVPVEDVYHAPAPKMSSARSYRTEPGSSTSQTMEPAEKSRPLQRRNRNRPPPAPEPEPSISDGTESEIAEGKEHDDLHQQIESFLAKFHEDMRLQRQESMARNMRIKQEFNHDD